MHRFSNSNLVIQMLALSNNPFTELCSSMGRLINLKDLLLDDLALVVPPREIIVRGPKKIVDYMSRIHNAHQACEIVRRKQEPDHAVEEFEIWKFSSDAPQKAINDSDFWKRRCVDHPTKSTHMCVLLISCGVGSSCGRFLQRHVDCGL